MYGIRQGAHSCFIILLPVPDLSGDYTALLAIIGPTQRSEGDIDRATNTRKPPRLSIVIPAYNEARRLPRTLARLHQYLGGQPYTWEIIVVSNASTDGTEALVRDLSADIPGLQLIALTGRGKGLAVRAGAIRSWGEVVFICDADLSMPPEEIARFLEAIASADVVVGSREAAGARRFDEPYHRHLMGRVFNRFVQLAAVHGIKDTQCGFKAFRREAADHLFGQQYVTGWGFDVEVLFLAQKFGYRLAEVGINWFFDADSRVRPGVDTLNMVTEVLMIRLRHLLRRYQPPRGLPVEVGDRERVG
jgi:dolichyl-phosphate beta-glucosyltransferase